MNGKKARRLRKEHGVKHVRLIGRAEASKDRNERAKEKRRLELEQRKTPVILPTEKDVRRYGI